MTTIHDNRGKEIPIPSSEQRRKEIREFARRQVEKHGVRERLGDYYHPPEFTRWKDYYRYCLWQEIQRVTDVGATSGTLTTVEVERLARQYRIAPSNRARYVCLATAYKRAGRHGVEALAHVLCVDPSAAIRAVESWLAARRRARRNQKATVVFPPPVPGAIDSEEAREIAEFCAGGCGEMRYARRNTSTGTTNRSSRRF